jgi:hypothetical protein
MSYLYDLGVLKDELWANPLGVHIMSSNPDHSKAAEISAYLTYGLISLYAFNHHEACRCFEYVISLDENCIMGHYGLSISHAPNYNMVFMLNISAYPSAHKAYYHSKTAFELLQDPKLKSLLHPIEIALVEALQCRFNPVPEIEDGSEIDDNTLAYLEAVKVRSTYNKTVTDELI